MTPRHVAKLVRKNLLRRPGRTALTVAGAGFAMFLLVLVESLSAGLGRALSGSEAARTLIVYRQNRYCPQTSFLPERYAGRIREVPHVVSVLPVKVFLNNCRASLDVVAFQGAPAEELFLARKIDVISGDREAFRREKDAALVGRAFASRRGLSAGDKFRFGGINVKVAGIFASPEPVEEGVILTHLEFLQRASPVRKLGTVTEFEVKIDDATRAKEVARAIDERLKDEEAPTDTRLKEQFLETATRDLREILRFARLLALACVAVALALVGNTVLIAVQERMTEFGVLRTLGFHGAHVVILVLLEALTLAVAGCAVGLAGAAAAVRFTHLAIGSEGVAVPFTISAAVVARGTVVAVATGAAAGLLPAVRAARKNVVAAIRGT